MNKYLFFLLCSLLVLSACRRDEEDLGYDPNGTEFRFGYNNEAVRVKTFDPPRRISAPQGAGTRQIGDSLDVDQDQIPDIVLEASYGDIMNGWIEFGGLSLYSTNGLYQFLMGPILFDSIYKCTDGTDTIAYNVASGYSCQNKEYLSFTVVKQTISFNFGDPKFDPRTDPNRGWDVQSAPLSNYSQGYSDTHQCNYRYENFMIPDNTPVYIQFQNRLTGQYGWLHLKVVNHTDLYLYEYGLEKLI